MTTRSYAAVIGLAVLLLVALPVRDADARDCRDGTPLPADVRLAAPGADVPPDAARFAGAWVGPWKGDGGDDTLDVEGLILAGEAVRPLCTPAVAAVTAPLPAPLDVAAVRASLTGHTFVFPRIPHDVRSPGVHRRRDGARPRRRPVGGHRRRAVLPHVERLGPRATTLLPRPPRRRRPRAAERRPVGRRQDPARTRSVVQAGGRGAVRRNTTRASVAVTMTPSAVTKIARYEPVTS